MAALESFAALGQQRISHIRAAMDKLTLDKSALPGAIALTAAGLVTGTILVNGFSENGFRLASQTGWRFTSIIFFAVLAACPTGRLAGRFIPALRLLGNITPELMRGFCASYGVYLLAVLVPNAIRLSMGALLFVLFGALVISVMAAAAAPRNLICGGTPWIGRRLARLRLRGSKMRRGLLGTAMAYFWLCYSLLALARIHGPHRPDAYYGISLLLMLLGLLLRFADRWVGPERSSL